MRQQPGIDVSKQVTPFYTRKTCRNAEHTTQWKNREKQCSLCVLNLCCILKWKCSDLKCIQKPTRSRLSLTHLPVQPLSRVKSLDGPRVHVISPVVKEKVYGGKDLLKSQVLSSEWNTERVREDASGDSGDGEDDELPCVIGESAGDCVWPSDEARGDQWGVCSIERVQ